MWPKVNDRRNVPKVEGAITRCPSTSWVRAVRSTSASSITSPPATIACSRVSTLRPGRWWPGRSPRSTSSSTTASIPSRSASVAVSARPALATAWWSSKATTRALGVCDDGIEKVPSEWGCMAGSQPPFSQLKGPFHNHSTAHATRRGGGSRLSVSYFPAAVAEDTALMAPGDFPPGGVVGVLGGAGHRVLRTYNEARSRLATEEELRAFGADPSLQPLHARVVLEITHGTYGAEDEALEALVSIRPATGNVIVFETYEGSDDEGDETTGVSGVGTAAGA